MARATKFVIVCIIEVEFYMGEICFVWCLVYNWEHGVGEYQHRRGNQNKIAMDTTYYKAETASTALKEKSQDRSHISELNKRLVNFTMRNVPHRHLAIKMEIKKYKASISRT